MKRVLIGEIECYYVNKGSGSWISYNTYPDRVKFEFDDEEMEKKFLSDVKTAKGYFYVCDTYGIEITNEGGFLTWLKKWMKENHVYFERTDYNKLTCTTTEIRYYEYDYK